MGINVDLRPLIIKRFFKNSFWWTFHEDEFEDFEVIDKKNNQIKWSSKIKNHIGVLRDGKPPPPIQTPFKTLFARLVNFIKLDSLVFAC